MEQEDPSKRERERERERDDPGWVALVEEP